MPDYQVISKLSPHGGEPLLGECVLHAGDAKIEFKHGRALVRSEDAHLLRHRDDVEIVGYDADTDPFNPDAANPGPLPTAAVPVEAVDPPVEGGKTILDEGGVTPPSEASENRDSEPDPEAVELAKEHLREEGEDVPEPEPTGTDEGAAGPILPEGFVLTTDDGENRCLAAKGDGEQCANVAHEGHACGIESHQEQVAARA